MYASTSNNDSSSRLINLRMRLVRPMVYSHPKAYAAVYLATGAWWLGLGIFLCTIGWFVGAALIVAAPLELVVAYRLLGVSRN